MSATSTNRADATELRYGDLCPRCNAASGIDCCPCLDGKCPIDVPTSPNYYEPRKEATNGR